MMPIVGRLIGSVQPKYLIALGGTIVALAMWHLTGLNGDITYGYAAMSRVFLALGLPFLFLPVTTASYDGIPPDKTNQASALINVARNIGGSMGVALAQTIFAQRQQFHQSRLVEHISPSDIGYQQTIDAVTRFFRRPGIEPAGCGLAGDRLGRPDPAAADRPALLYRRVPDAGDHRRADGAARADHAAGSISAALREGIEGAFKRQLLDSIALTPATDAA